MSLFGQPLAMRSRVWVSQACGSTWFILAVASSVAMVAHVRPLLAEARIEHRHVT